MRRALNAALVVAGVLVNVLASRDTTVANSQAARLPVQNGTIVYGLHVALPSNMKNFPPELVPLPGFRRIGRWRVWSGPRLCG